MSWDTWSCKGGMSLGGPGSGQYKREKRGPKPRTLKILELRKQGLLQKEIAEVIGCSRYTVHEACVKYGLKQEEVQTTEQEAIDIIDRAGYDYICGFYNSHSKVTVRCRECGGIFERMYRVLREKAIGTYKNQMSCPHCYRNEIENNRQEKKLPKIREAQERARRKAERDSRKAIEQMAKRLAIHVCQNCGKEYCIELSGYDSERYCSEKCQKRYYNRAKNEKRMKRLKSREHDTDITLEKLFERDAGVCYICGKRCDWSDIVEQDGTMIAGDNYPSIDHVKPVSKGGTHTWDNIKLACRLCNTLKGWK